MKRNAPGIGRAQGVSPARRSRFRPLRRPTVWQGTISFPISVPGPWRRHSLALGPRDLVATGVCCSPRGAIFFTKRQTETDRNEFQFPGAFDRNWPTGAKQQSQAPNEKQLTGKWFGWSCRWWQWKNESFPKLSWAQLVLGKSIWKLLFALQPTNVVQCDASMLRRWMLLSFRKTRVTGRAQPSCLL